MERRYYLFGAILLALALLLSIKPTSIESNTNRVFMMREYMESTFRGPAFVIEYFIDGTPSVAVFYDGDAELLVEFREYLRSVNK